MGRLAFIMTGPHGGQIVDMDEKELATAIEDGWAMDFQEANMGGNPDPFAGWNTKSHEKAEAYLTSKGLYATREMRAEKPAADRPEPAEPAKSTSGDRADEIEQEERKRDTAKAGPRTRKSTDKK